MKALIIFLSLVFVGCVTGGSTNRAVAAYYGSETFLNVCTQHNSSTVCFEEFKYIKRAMKHIRGGREQVYRCIQRDCPAGPNFLSCVGDCVNAVRRRNN